MKTYRYTLKEGQSTRTGLLSLPSSWDEVTMSIGVRRAIVALDDDALSIEIIRDSIGTKHLHQIPDDALLAVIGEVKRHVSLSAVPSRDGFDRGTLEQLQAIEDFVKYYDASADWSTIRQQLAPLLRRRPYIIPRSDIMLYCLATLQKIHSMYRTTLFRKSSEVQEGSPFGWFSISLQIAKTGVFGDINGVMHRRFHDVAIHLIEEQREADRIQEMHRSMSSRGSQYSY